MPGIEDFLDVLIPTKALSIIAGFSEAH